MATIIGRDVRSLRGLAVRLARESYFGDDIMSNSSPSGKGGFGRALLQLDPAGMKQIKSIIRQRSRGNSELEFEAIWVKCLASISKACQNLRNGRLMKKKL